MSGSIIQVKHRGNFNKTQKWFNRVLKRDYLNILSEYANRGIEALKAATPTDSGKTASSWEYEINSNKGITTVSFINNHEENGLNVVILLVHGHGTRNGGYVQGNDFVSPALAPIFAELADSMWKGVTE